MKQDKLIIGGHEFDSRFILGSGKYSLDLINAAVQNAGAQIITLALRRTNTNDTANILDYIPEGVTLLPNTSNHLTYFLYDYFTSSSLQSQLQAYFKVTSK